MGTPALALPTLEALSEAHQLVGVATQPDRPRRRGKRLEPSPTKAWAIARGIPVLQPETLRGSGEVARLVSLQPDVAVVVAYGLILPPPVLELPRLGCVNVHASLLPRHRGASPIQAAILAGDQVSGVTTMLMDEGLDTGPVLLRREVRVEPRDTAASLGDRLARAGAELVLRTLTALAAGTIEPQPQDASEATMTRLIRKQDGRIDWRDAGVAIDRHVRAMQPWPGAWTEWGDARLRIWCVETQPGSSGVPAGRVVSSAGELVVGCGDGLVRVLELQRAGGRRMAAADFVRGAALISGAVLGTAG